MKLAPKIMNKVFNFVECRYLLRNELSLSHETLALLGMEFKLPFLLAPGYGPIYPVN